MTDLSSSIHTVQRVIRQRRWLSFVLLALLSWLIVVIVPYYSQLWSAILTGSFARPRFDGNPTLPYLGAALQHAVVGIGRMGILLLSAVLFGRLLTRAGRWQYANWREELLTVVTFGIGGFSYVGLALASVGLYRMEVVRCIVAAILGGGLIWWLKSRTKRQTRSITSIRPPSRAQWVWIGCTGLAILCALIAALAPEQEYDALWYHLAYPQRYLQQGSLVDLPHDYVSLYPMTWELWFGYGLAFGGQTTATLLHFACLPLGAIATYTLAERSGYKPVAWQAAALFATVPTVMWEASTAYIDLALALHVTLGLYALLRYTEQREQQWLLIAAFNIGLALATKHLALVVWGLACFGLALRLWWIERRLKPVFHPVLLLAGLSLLLPLPWYVRSWLATGNPVFPELYNIFGAPPQRWDALTAQGLAGFLNQFGRPRTIFNLLTLPWHMTQHAANYHGTLGPLFLMLLPALALRRWRGALPWLAAFTLGFMLLWASPLASFQMRFLVPITPLLAVLAAAAYTRLAALTRQVGGCRFVHMLTGVMGVLLMLNLPPFTALHERDRNGYEGWINSTLHGLPLAVVLGGETRERYLVRKVRSYAIWDVANRTLPKDARVLTWTGGDQFYAQRDRMWVYATAARSAVWAKPNQVDLALGELRKHGITHLIIPPDGNGADEQPTALTDARTRNQWYELLYHDRFYALYRIRWEQWKSTVEGVNP